VTVVAPAQKAFATLNTFSFQAPDFYRQFGYRIVATVEGLPEGHRQHTLVKDLNQ
jgi:hypothetical protein